MGRGIAGILPVTFYTEEITLRWSLERLLQCTDENFFDFYTETDSDDPKYRFYKIKGDILLKHLKAFFFEFHMLIKGEIPERAVGTFNDEYDEIVQQNNFEALMEHIDKHNFPKYYKGMSEIFFSSCANIDCIDYILFYIGSYKAIMEEYVSLLHMQKLLVKAIDNPLSKITQFGIFG